MSWEQLLSPQPGFSLPLEFAVQILQWIVRNEDACWDCYPLSFHELTVGLLIDKPPFPFQTREGRWGPS